MFSAATQTSSTDGDPGACRVLVRPRDLETNSFPASSGYLRFTWETSNETKLGEGRFKLILGSSISGRPIQVVVDSKGASHDVAYVSEDPRTFYIKVESANENWKVIVDEGFSATIEPKH